MFANKATDYEYEYEQSKGFLHEILAVFGFAMSFLCYMFSAKPSAQEVRSTNELHNKDMSVLVSFGMVTVFLILSISAWLMIDVLGPIVCRMFPASTEGIRNYKAKRDYYEG